MWEDKCGSCANFKFEPNVWHPQSGGICLCREGFDSTVDRNNSCIDDYVPISEIRNFGRPEWNNYEGAELERAEKLVRERGYYVR